MSIFYTKNTQKKMSSRKNRGASVRLSSDNEQNKVRKIAANLKNAMCIMLGAGFIYFTVMYFGEFYENLNEQKIEFVKIEGSLDYISEEEVSSVVSRFTDTSLVTVDLGLVKQQLEMNPWVQSVSIRREWPETLIININEELPIARWRQNQLLNQEGKVFSPENVLAQMYLPYLTGPEGSEQEVMEQYQKFNQLLYPLGLRIVILGMNSRGAWNIELGNGIKINVGKTNVMEKMRRLVGFIDSYLNEQIVNIESIDLRYSNGISIKKRENSSEEVVSL